jgi:hypothetical protein
MGITLSPDIAQQIMDVIFEDMEEVEVYLDDIGIFSNDYEMHGMTSIRTVSDRLQENGFTVNPVKCE